MLLLSSDTDANVDDDCTDGNDEEKPMFEEPSENEDDEEPLSFDEPATSQHDEDDGDVKDQPLFESGDTDANVDRHCRSIRA